MALKVLNKKLHQRMPVELYIRRPAYPQAMMNQQDQQKTFHRRDHQLEEWVVQHAMLESGNIAQDTQGTGSRLDGTTLNPNTTTAPSAKQIKASM